MAPTDVSDEKWLDDYHIEGKTCSKEVPICNSEQIPYHVNSPLFSKHTPGNPQNTGRQPIKAGPSRTCRTPPSARHQTGARTSVPSVRVCHA